MKPILKINVRFLSPNTFSPKRDFKVCSSYRYSFCGNSNNKIGCYKVHKKTFALPYFTSNKHVKVKSCIYRLTKNRIF